MCALYARAAADVRAARRSGGGTHECANKKAPLYRPAREAGARVHLGFPSRARLGA